MRPPHEVLGIAENATRAEIDEAYRRKLLYTNPSVFAEGTPERKNANEAREEIKEAHAALLSLSQPQATAIPAVQHISDKRESNRILTPILIIGAIIIISMGSVFAMNAQRSSKNNSAATQQMETGKGNAISKVAEKVMPSSVLIEVEQTNEDLVYGSGFFVNSLGDILTNYHVIKNASSISIMTNGQNSYDAKVRAFDVRADMALLSSTTPFSESVPLVITETLPSVGEEIVVVGSPEEEFQSVSNGIVSGIRDKGGITVIQITAPISHGSSGGPVVNMQSEVVGISTATRTDAQNLNFAVSSKHLASFVAYAEKMPPMPLLAKTSKPQRKTSSSGVMSPTAPKAQEDTNKLPLPDEFGFMSHRWGCSVEDMRSRLPNLQRQPFPTTDQKTSTYSTLLPFRAFDCNAHVLVFYEFYKNRLCEVSFMAFFPDQMIPSPAGPIVKELNRMFGIPEIIPAQEEGGNSISIWGKGEGMRVLIVDPFSRDKVFVRFIYWPIWRESWRSDSGTWNADDEYYD